MKKALKITFSLLLVVILATGIFTFNTSAATATTHFSPSKTDFSVGEEITVTIKFDAGVQVFSIDGALSYDSTIVQYVSGGGADQGGSVKIAEALSGEKKVEVSVTFKTIAEGKCNFSFSGFCTDQSLTPHNASTGYFINVKNPTTSSNPSSNTTPIPSENANLASLKVSGATLSPKFNSNTTNYTVTVPFATDKITISAGVADAGATLVGAGTINLNVGDNRRTITVTAASGAKKSYNLVITRLAENQDDPKPPVNDTDPLLITAEGINRVIMQDITSMPIPEGFSASTITINEEQVGALTEGGEKYTLFYTTLEDGSDAALYYKDSVGRYKRLRYIEVNSKFYILENVPESYPPSGWYRDVLDVQGGTVSVFRSEDTVLKDFCVLYCYVDGAYGFYRFDSLETTIQRAPDFKVSEQASTVAPKPDKENIFKRFAKMNSTGKAVIILIGIAVICIAILLVMLILRLVNTSKDQEDDAVLDDTNQSEQTMFNFALDDEKQTEKTDKEW